MVYVPPILSVPAMFVVMHCHCAQLAKGTAWTVINYIYFFKRGLAIASALQVESIKEAEAEEEALFDKFFGRPGKRSKCQCKTGACPGAQPGGPA